MDNTILIAIEEPLIVKGLKYSLEQDGYIVDTAYSREETLKKTGLNTYGLIIIDISSPENNGLNIYQTIRKKSNTPVLVLTANGEDLGGIMNHEQGAYGFLTKPINIVEFKSKVNAVMMRAEGRNNLSAGIIKLWNLTIDTLSRRIFDGNREIDLTSREYNILIFLAQNKNRVYSREDLLREIWGNGYSGDRRIVDVHIRRLREKLESDPSNPMYIMTSWGTGYYFNG